MAMAAMKLQNGSPKSCGYHSTLRSHDSGHSHNEIAEFSHGGPKFPSEKNSFNTSFSKRELRTLCSFLLCPVWHATTDSQAGQEKKHVNVGLYFY